MHPNHNTFSLTEAKGHDVTTTNLTISGMTCAHCAMSVREELAELPGVTSVVADFAAGTAVVESDAPLNADAVRTAVAEAGYELAALN